MTIIPETKPSSLPELNESTSENIQELPVTQEVPQEENNLPTVEEVLQNHEVRLNAIEAALLRIRGAI